MSIAVPITTIGTISNYGQLLATVHNYMDRNDLADKLPDYLRLVESTLNRRLRCLEMEAIGSISVTNGAGPLPADFLEARRVTYDGRALNYHPPQHMADLRAAKAVQICEYSIIGLDMVIAPLTDAELMLLYYKKIQPLTENIPINWLLLAHPDLYLAGCMHEACAELGDDKALLWLQKYEGLIEEVQQYSNERRIGANLAMVPQAQLRHSRL